VSVYVILVVAAALVTWAAPAVWVGFDAKAFDWRGNPYGDRPWKWVSNFLFGRLWWALPLYLSERRHVPRRAIKSGATGGGKGGAAPISGLAAIHRYEYVPRHPGGGGDAATDGDTDG
jgi:hypothetical protein